MKTNEVEEKFEKKLFVSEQYKKPPTEDSDYWCCLCCAVKRRKIKVKCKVKMWMNEKCSQDTRNKLLSYSSEKKNWKLWENVEKYRT